MDHLEPEEHQFLGLAGVLSSSVGLICAPRHRRLFLQIALSLVLPLSFLFLLHIHISHLLFSRIRRDEISLDLSPPNSPSSSAYLSDLSDQWALFLLFKALYLLALLAFSLLATSAAVYSVASIFSNRDELHFSKLLLVVVPRVWRRLMLTFLWAFVVLLAYHLVSAAVIVAFLFLLGPNAFGIMVVVILFLVYLAGLVWISVIWHLASVISVLEDSFGIEAMRKSRNLIKGKTLLACGILLLLNLVFVGTEFGFRRLVVEWRGYGAATRFFFGIVMWALLMAVILVGLVAQTVVYFVCKSYHHESIDKSSLADHLEVYLGEYEPLKGRDVQMEHFEV